MTTFSVTLTSSLRKKKTYFKVFRIYFRLTSLVYQIPILYAIKHKKRDKSYPPNTHKFVQLPNNRKENFYTGERNWRKKKNKKEKKWKSKCEKGKEPTSQIAISFKPFALTKLSLHKRRRLNKKICSYDSVREKLFLVVPFSFLETRDVGEECSLF